MGRGVRIALCNGRLQCPYEWRPARQRLAASGQHAAALSCNDPPFVERLLDHAPTPLSEHAQGLMYAMAITRLVNGIVDPMQQASRALSVKRLAQSVGMPTVLVELRHECTHNRMPSLDRALRAAADEALLWLHGHYWLPQQALRVECSDSIHGCLRTYQQAAESRLADGEQPLRKDVVACALGLEKAVAPAWLATHLVAALFDHGYLAPPPASSASAPLTGRSEGTRGIRATATNRRRGCVRAGRGSRSSRGGGGRGAGGGGGGEGEAGKAGRRGGSTRGGQQRTDRCGGRGGRRHFPR